MEQQYQARPPGFRQRINAMVRDMLREQDAARRLTNGQAPKDSMRRNSALLGLRLPADGRGR
jgi:hypothetical protein